ncbi:hypothetical protein SLA2020_071970 [Shorea laevis]
MLENKVLGPDEWLDSEIERLRGILQRKEGMDPSRDGAYNSKGENETGDIIKETDTNGVMVQDEMATGGSDSDSVNLSSNAESNTTNTTEELHICSSSTVNYGFDEEWLDWEFSGFGDQLQCFDDQWELWGDRDLNRMLCWLWDGGNNGEGEGFQ